MVAMALVAALLLLSAPAQAAPPRPFDEPPAPLWVVNVSSLPPHIVPLFQSAQGVVNRAGGPAVLLVGLATDGGAERTILPFLRSRFGPWLAYDESRYLAGSAAWDLFQQPFVRAAVRGVVFCGSADANPALSAALSVAAAHGSAAAVCASPSSRREILGRTQLPLLADLSGRWPALDGNGTALGARQCQSVNAFVAALPSANFSNRSFATWPAEPPGGAPTTGYDHCASERMLVMCMDSAAADWNSTQASLLARYPPLSFGFGWWTKEGPDIAALSARGQTWLGGGHSLSLFSRLPSLTPHTPQPTRSLPAVADGASLVVFSFTQGDAAAFDQKINLRNLMLQSAVEPVSAATSARSLLLRL